MDYSRIKVLLSYLDERADSKYKTDRKKKPTKANFNSPIGQKFLRLVTKALSKYFLS